MSRFKPNLSILLLVLLLCFGTTVPALADGETPSEQSEGVPTLGTVYITKQSYFELKDMNILHDNGGKNVAFTVTIHNNDSADLMFINYWIHLVTKSGNQISVRLLPQDKDKNRITPKSTQDIGFYATVNEETNLSDLVVQFIQWDFSQPNFERLLGEIAVPDTYSVVTPIGEWRTVKMAGIPVSTHIKKAMKSKNEKYYNITAIFEMENIGPKNVALPAYQFAIRTGEGYMYPLDAKNLKDLSIDPKVNKEVQLSGSIPVSVSPDGWQLVIVQNMTDLKLNLAVAYYEMPTVSETEGGDIGKDYTFTNKDGVYNAQITSITRVPWEDQDIVAANVKLTDKGVDALPLPNLTGYFYLDEAVKVEAKLIKTDNVIGLAPNASVNFQFVGKMPYTYQFNKIKLVLQEKESETVTNDLVEFVNGSEMLNVPYNNAGESFAVQHIGRSASYKVRDVRTYTGDTADTYMVMLEAANLEKRNASVPKLVVSFKTPDGTVFPATVSDIKSKISPAGKALLFLTTELPKGYPTSGMNIMIGEAITDGKLTEGDNKPDGYINPAAFWLPQESFTVQDGLDKVDIAPYSISINHIATVLKLGELKLTFNYEITKDLLMTTNTEGRKLVIGFEDEKGNKTFTREFDFKDFEDVKPNDGSKDTKLRLGKADGFEIKETDQDLIFKLETLKTYKMSVYDSFNGQRKLLATKKIDWFSTTD